MDLITWIEKSVGCGCCEPMPVPYLPEVRGRRRRVGWRELYGFYNLRKGVDGAAWLRQEVRTDLSINKTYNQYESMVSSGTRVLVDRYEPSAGRWVQEEYVSYAYTRWYVSGEYRYQVEGRVEGYARTMERNMRTGEVAQWNNGVREQRVQKTYGYGEGGERFGALIQTQASTRDVSFGNADSFPLANAATEVLMVDEVGVFERKRESAENGYLSKYRVSWQDELTVGRGLTELRGLAGVGDVEEDFEFDIPNAAANLGFLEYRRILPVGGFDASTNAPGSGLTRVAEVSGYSWVRVGFVSGVEDGHERAVVEAGLVGGRFDSSLAGTPPVACRELVSGIVALRPHRQEPSEWLELDLFGEDVSGLFDVTDGADRDQVVRVGLGKMRVRYMENHPQGNPWRLVPGLPDRTLFLPLEEGGA